VVILPRQTEFNTGRRQEIQNIDGRRNFAKLGPQHLNPEGMNARKVLIYVVLVVVAVNLAIVAVVFTGENKPARPLPNPNGYDDFVKAGELALDADQRTLVKLDDSSLAKAMQKATNIYVDYKEMNKEQLAALIATNAQALTLVRIGIGKECLQPVAFSKDYDLKLLPELSSFKQLGRLLEANGRLEELNGRTNEAAMDYMELIAFSQKLSRGGLVITKLVGIALEKIALSSLHPLLPNLSAPECRKIAGDLENFDTHEEPVTNIFQWDKDWDNAVFGLRTRIQSLLASKSQQQSKALAVSKIQATQYARRLLMLDFAARAYELEKGKPPQSVTDLVPDYLKAVPKDPVTGKDLGLGR
jgi:hypothetical protein